MNLERIISVGMDFDGCFLVAWILVLAAAFAFTFRDSPIAAHALEVVKHRRP
jgi:hypothetical protein